MMVEDRRLTDWLNLWFDQNVTPENKDETSKLLTDALPLLVSLYTFLKVDEMSDAAKRRLVSLGEPSEGNIPHNTRLN